jgi:hypothetical protein
MQVNLTSQFSPILIICYLIKSFLFVETYENQSNLKNNHDTPIIRNMGRVGKVGVIVSRMLLARMLLLHAALPRWITILRLWISQSN